MKPNALGFVAGEGAYLLDMDGNKLIDYYLGMGPMILGYNPSSIKKAIQKGIEAAKKNLVKLPIYNGTIPHEQSAKFKGASVLIKPASNGTGVKAGGAMRAVLESAGVKDILAKSKGSSNPHNLVKATLMALLELRDPRAIAMQRGITMDKVFNG